MGGGKTSLDFLSESDSEVEEMNIHQVVLSVNVT